jgi:hypothetical protein
MSGRRKSRFQFVQKLLLQSTSGFGCRGALIILDIVNDKILETIPLFSTVKDVAISPDGQEIYLTLGEAIIIFDSSSSDFL